MSYISQNLPQSRGFDRVPAEHLIETVPNPRADQDIPRVLGTIQRIGVPVIRAQGIATGLESLRAGDIAPASAYGQRNKELPAINLTRTKED